MLELKNLLYSLTSLLILFHDSQSLLKNKFVSTTHPILRARESREQAIKILKDTPDSFNEVLHGLIMKCNEVYKERTPFLIYILNNINFLHEALNREKSYTSSQLNEFYQQMGQMLVDFRTLLMTSKTNTHEVIHYSTAYSHKNSLEPCSSLIGLVNNAYIGSYFCNSGELLNKEVMMMLHLPIPTSDFSAFDEKKELNAIQVTAKKICNQFQDVLLYKELLAQQEKLTELVDNQRTVINTFNSESISDKDLITKLKQQIAQLSCLNEDLETELKLAQSVIKEQEHLLADYKNTEKNNQNLLSKLPAKIIFNKSDNLKFNTSPLTGVGMFATQFPINNLANNNSPSNGSNSTRFE